jgi:hypothetical protein
MLQSALHQSESQYVNVIMSFQIAYAVGYVLSVV